MPRLSGSEARIDCVTNLLQPLLLQTDDVQVEICPQPIGLVEENTSGQTVPVSLQTAA